MDYLQGIYPLIYKTQVGEGAFSFVIECPNLAEKARAGQFVHIKVPGKFLRRPISICEVDRENGCITIVFEVRGEGTKLLGECSIGDTMDVMGPLGNGFALLEPGQKAIVIGGGIGVPPLVEVAKHYGGNCSAIIGFRDESKVILEERLVEICENVFTATDDGSYGFHGLVTQVLERELLKEKPAIIYACGPKPMLAGVAKLAAAAGVRCQVSMEERMGCGVGACLVCACKTRGEDGKEGYSHVCKNGPVFEAEEVVF